MKLKKHGMCIHGSFIYLTVISTLKTETNYLEFQNIYFMKHLLLGLKYKHNYEFCKMALTVLYYVS